MNKRIIAVCGKVCSGKNTFANNLVLHTQIDIGSIVREIKQQDARIHDKSLDAEIIKRLSKILNDYDSYVITGVRQITILRYLAFEIGDCDFVWLEVPEEELKRRFLARKSEKDKDLSFEEVIKRDNELGLKQIEQWKQNYPHIFTIINHY